MLEAPDKSGRLAALKAQIRRLEGLPAADSDDAIPLGVPAIDAALPGGGLPRGCVHEILPADGAADGAVTAFTTALTAALCASGASLLWLCGAAGGGVVYPPGLLPYGLSPARVVFVAARSGRDLLWALEEALRCPHVGAVVAELGTIGCLDLGTSRRLQLAAETGGGTGLLLTAGNLGSSTAVRTTAGKEGRDHRVKSAASAAVTRWRISACRSLLRGGEPGLGVPCWEVELLRCRGGRPGVWHLAWMADQSGMGGGLVAADAVVGTERQFEGSAEIIAAQATTRGPIGPTTSKSTGPLRRVG